MVREEVVRISRLAAFGGLTDVDVTLVLMNYCLGIYMIGDVNTMKFNIDNLCEYYFPSCKQALKDNLYNYYFELRKQTEILNEINSLIDNYDTYVKDLYKKLQAEFKKLKNYK